MIYTRPAASIIIVTYNGLEYLEDCLRSVLVQLEPRDEVIVVDNNSRDGSAEFTQSIYSGANIIRNLENRGFAAGCNQGAQQATGEFLVFLNQDTRVCPGWLAALLEPLVSAPAVGLTTSKLLLMSQPDRINMCGQEIHFTGLSFGRGYQARAGLYNEPATVAAVSGASFAIRQELWQRLGGFDQAFFMYYEETDLSWRAKLAGYRSLYVPASLALHDYKPAKPSQNGLYYSKRNRYYLIFKNFRLLTLLLISPSLILAEIADCLHCFLVGRLAWQAKWQACWWLVLNFHQVLRSRRLVQATRSYGDRQLFELCSYRINPVEFNGGLPGRLAVVIFNAFFALNYWCVKMLVK